MTLKYWKDRLGILKEGVEESGAARFGLAVLDPVGERLEETGADWMEDLKQLNTLGGVLGPTGPFRSDWSQSKDRRKPKLWFIVWLRK